MKPKFKVGDGAVMVDDVTQVIIITAINKDFYDYALLGDKNSGRWINCSAPFDWIDEVYTLDLNHYIKSL